MTQQPFSRPGAVDLSGLSRPAAHVVGRRRRRPATTRGSSYALDVTEQNFQTRARASVTAPVVLVFYSPTPRRPRAPRWPTTSRPRPSEYDGRFLAGLVDIDAAPTIAQALQIPQVPLLMVILDGRPAAQPIPGVLSARRDPHPAQPARAGAHRAGHHRRGTSRSPPPRRRATRARSRRSTRATPPPSRRWRTTTSTAPSRSTNGSSTPTRPTPRRPPGWRWPRCCSAPRASTSTPPARPPRPNPDDVDAQTLVADLDLLGGHVDDAFARLVDLVRRTAGDERNQAREHLIGLFAAVGNDDPRVLRGRQNLASALF